MQNSSGTPDFSLQPRLLSVILPTYNGADTLDEQLEALSAQQYDGAWEVVIVDNGSTDDTVTVIQKYQQRIPCLRLVQALEKQSKGYALNIGARLARGEALIFCDQDDVVAPGWLAAFAEGLETHEFVAGKIDVDKLNQNTAWRPAPPNGGKQSVLGFLPFVIGCNLGVSRTAFETVNGFSEDVPIADDIDFSWRLQLQGYCIYDAPDALVEYRYRKQASKMWKQLVSYAEAHPHLYRRFAGYGMPRSSTKKVLWRYWWLIKLTPRLLKAKPRTRMKWLYRAALSWGRIKGSWRYRVLYL